MEKDAPIDSAFSPVSFWSMGVITPVCQSFGVLPENLATWNTRVGHKTPLFKAVSISGQILSQPAAFPALSVLTARKSVLQ